MGEARDLIEGKTTDVSADPESVLGKLDDVLDDIDTALQIKLGDLMREGPSKKLENQYKIGFLRGADALIRRALAMIEDCYEPVDLNGDVSAEESAEVPDAVET